jgi:LacI family transcriptional regulator
MEPTPVVYLFVPMRFSYGREIIRGVREYTHKNRLWQLAVAEPTPRNIRAAKSERPDGIIGLFATDELERLVRSLKVTAVNVSSRCKGIRLPGVIPGNTAIARLAARHFIERGFRQFACGGHREHYFSQVRFAAFKSALKDAGFDDCHYLPDGQDLRSLRGLAKPVGIFACSDDRARQILSACVRCHIKVPQEAAVVGVDNDEAMCELADVPMSSIDPNGRRIGFEAAAALDELMAGRRLENKLVEIPPAGLVVRSSSDVLAIPDEEVANAMRYMQAHACDPMRVEDMMGVLRVSRRTLEKRFRTIVGRTLHDEIRRLQFERARKLLCETDMKIPQVATKCGFRDPKRFTTLFREEFGAPPVAFRRDARTASGR